MSGVQAEMRENETAVRSRQEITAQGEARWRDEVAARLQAHRARCGGSAAPAPEAGPSDEAEETLPLSPATAAARALARRLAEGPLQKPLTRVPADELHAQPSFFDPPPVPAEAGEVIYERVYERVYERGFFPEPAAPADAPPRPAAQAKPAVSAPAPPDAFIQDDVTFEDESGEEIVVEGYSNIIEFPRALVAKKKAPRRDEPTLAPNGDRLADPVEAPENVCPSGRRADQAAHMARWAGLRLDDTPSLRIEEAPAELEVPIRAAAIEKRFACYLVDAAVVLGGSLLLLAAFCALAHGLPRGKMALAAAGAVPLLVFSLYQWIFLSWNGMTPGMQSQRLALCTFDDDMPQRTVRRLRAIALTLSALSLGAGFAWALLDEDRLGWHDRISRTYLREF